MRFSLGHVAGLVGAVSFAVASAPPPDTLWQVTPKINYSDPLYAGWDQIPVVKEIEVYNGVAEGRTYAHHPELIAIGDTVYLLYSSAPVDEDSMGQDVWISTSKDGGMTWTKGYSLMPAAMLPNQTNPRNYSYWCDRGIAQRAWQANTFVHLPGPGKDGELYAIGQSASRWCPAAYRTAGRIARRINFDGEPDGDVCWLEKNELTVIELFAKTIYGKKKGCARACEINAMLQKPNLVPAWTTWLYNHELFAADDTHWMQEQTHAVWHEDGDSPTGGYWQRFWRDISDNNTLSVWVEYNEDKEGRGWYPRRLAQYGNKIFQTNMPDDKTKQYLGTLSGSGDRYFISNPKYNATTPERQPLTIAMSRGKDQTYRSIGVLRTNASDAVAPDSRNGLKTHAHGFSYPTAVQVGNKLVVAYSESKQNIWVSVVNVDNLPKEEDTCY